VGTGSRKGVALHAGVKEQRDKNYHNSIDGCIIVK
jgi:hypothetical protein